LAGDHLFHPLILKLQGGGRKERHLGWPIALPDQAADAAAIRGVLDVGITGFLSAVQEALPDLRQQKDAAILVTNGGLGYFDPKLDAGAVQWNAMGLAVANAAKHKLCGLLSAKLAPEKIYVGEAMVLGSIKGSAFDSGQATLEATTVADKFWELYQARTAVTGEVG
jgi:hypothetical protein